MTTSPVISITDELIAELEESANQATHKNWAGRGDEIGYISREDDQSYGMFCPLAIVHSERNVDYISMVTPRLILSLLAERAELIKDRDRLEKLAAHMRFFYGRHDAGAWEFPEVVIKSTREQCTVDHLRAAIDSMVDDNE